MLNPVSDQRIYSKMLQCDLKNQSWKDKKMENFQLATKMQFRFK